MRLYVCVCVCENRCTRDPLTSRLPRIARFSFPACLMALTRRLKLTCIRRRMKKRSQPACAVAIETPNRSDCWICFMLSFTGLMTSKMTRRSFVVNGTPSRFIAMRRILSVTMLGACFAKRDNENVLLIALAIWWVRRRATRDSFGWPTDVKRKSTFFSPFFETRSRNMLRSACGGGRRRSKQGRGSA